MADISKITVLNGSSYDLKDANARETLSNLAKTYVVKGTQNTATGSWTGSIPVASLTDGLTIYYYLPRNGNGDATLNLTLSDNSSSGAIPVYYSGNTRMTTQYEAGSMITLTYWSSASISIDGTATSSARWISHSPTGMPWEDF